MRAAAAALGVCARSGSEDFLPACQHESQQMRQLIRPRIVDLDPIKARGDSACPVHAFASSMVKCRNELTAQCLPIDPTLSVSAIPSSAVPSAARAPPLIIIA